MRQKKQDNLWENWQNGNNKHETNRFCCEEKKIITRRENKEINQRERKKRNEKKRPNKKQFKNKKKTKKWWKGKSNRTKDAKNKR